MAHILIAEDEPRLAAFLEKGLAAAGHTTTTAWDGPAALSMAIDGTVDLLLLDVGLPGIDGLAVIRELRKRGSRLPIIVMSAREEPPGHGGNDYLRKPFSVAELLARANEQLRAQRN